jgi:hypothetical protein
MITALGQAMTVAAAALRRLVPQGPLDMQQLRQLLHLFNYVLALPHACNSCNHGVGDFCVSPDWLTTYSAEPALSAALLEALPPLSDNPPLAAAGARSGRSGSRSSRGRGSRSGAAGAAAACTGFSSSIGMEESINNWEELTWLSICTRSVQTLAIAGRRFVRQLGITVRCDRDDPQEMSMLGSRDVLSVAVFEAAGVARSLHKAAGGKLHLPAAAPAGSSSSSRRSQAQQQQQQQQFVPALHNLLFEAIGGPTLLNCIDVTAADSQWNAPTPTLQQRALVCINGLALLLLGQAADPGPDPGAFWCVQDRLVATSTAAPPLSTWPPAATFPPERQQQLVGPLMQVVVELLLLLPDGLDGKQGTLLEGLELLHHLAGLQQHSAPGLVAMVEPVLLLLGPAVTRAVTQQQQGAASSAWAVEAWQRYGLLLARLLRSGEWLWLEASGARDRSMLQRDLYERGFSRCPCQTAPTSCVPPACCLPCSATSLCSQHSGARSPCLC